MTALPPTIGLVLDRSVRCYRDGHVLVGGSPPRLMRLTTSGSAALRSLVADQDPGEPGRRLARRLIDAGLAHPTACRAAGTSSVSVIVPVRDRARELDRCLATIDSEVPVLVVDDGSVSAAAIADACRRHGAQLLRHDRPAGPAAARNAALARVATDLVAFLDSDCVPAPGWLGAVAGHFDDPLVGAVAPRVVPAPPAGRPSTRERYAAARSPLDMGTDASRVAPGGRVSYVPTAALVVRRDAIGHAFDPELRFGEDVDLVWRLHDAGWRVRYDPAATVHHTEPQTWVRLLARRWRYGTSAAPLARRHHDRLAPLVLRPLPTAAALLLLAREPLPAAVVAGVHAAVLARRTRRAGAPARRRRALAWSAQSLTLTLVGCSRAATTLAAPALLAGLRWRRSRPAAAALLVAAPLHDWAQRRPALDPVRWTMAYLADEAAYGLGVWSGCVRHRVVRPLLPTLGRSR